MASFFVYDITFLIVFTLFVIWFIYKKNQLPKKHNPLSKEGIIYMYRTQLGIKAINYVGDNFKKTLHFLKWPIVITGLILMAAMLWMLVQTIAIYLLIPEITNYIKAPPIAPLIPYFPKLFGLQSFFPPFYFTYFILALAVVAVVHEFSHGMYMRLFKVKIKSTGLVFLGPILGAFVEEEKKGFEKKKNLEQMTILAAGVFANLVFALIFYLLYVAFFLGSFAPVGYQFDTYGLSAVPLQDITGFEAYGNLTRVNTKQGENYYLDENLALQLELEQQTEHLIAYAEAPAVLLQVKGIITHLDNVKIMGQESLRAFLETKEPGDRISITTLQEDGSSQTYSAQLTTHPEDENKAYLGVGNSAGGRPRGFVQRFLASFMSFKDPTAYYEPTWDGELAEFILYLLWWIMIINLLVALFNMLPLGMLDGGRFFYLAVLSVTKSEKVAKKAYKLMGQIILIIFLLLMFLWFIRII